MEQKKYVFVSAGWDVDGNPFCLVHGPSTYKEAKDEFDCSLMIELGIDPEEDGKEQADYHRKYANIDKYDDYEGRYLLQVKEMEE